MFHELINLLQRERFNALRRNYFLKLATVAVLGLSVVVVAHGVLLLPSYIFVLEQTASREAHLVYLEAKFATEEEQEADARLSVLRIDTEYLVRLSSYATASAAIGALLTLPRPGIQLSEITYNAPTTKNGEGKMTVSGTAATRDALRRYDIALSNAPYVTSANLPISAYAKESDIHFIITLSGSLQP